jgi:hypothetical protein
MHDGQQNFKFIFTSLHDVLLQKGEIVTITAKEVGNNVLHTLFQGHTSLLYKSTVFFHGIDLVSSTFSRL